VQDDEGEFVIPTAIITAKRPEGYLHRTIESLASTGWLEGGEPLRIIAGDTNNPDLDAYRGRDGYALWEMNESDIAAWEPLSPVQRCVSAHLRAWRVMREIAILRGYPCVLICEDDVMFSSRMVESLPRIIEGMESSLPSPWALTLCRYDAEPRDASMGIIWQAIEASRHMGMQGVVYSTWALSGLPEYAERFIGHQAPPDALLSMFARHNGVILGAASPSLVQHIGERSVVGHGAFRTAGDYVA